MASHRLWWKRSSLRLSAFCCSLDVQDNCSGFLAGPRLWSCAMSSRCIFLLSACSAIHLSSSSPSVLALWDAVDQNEYDSEGRKCERLLAGSRKTSVGGVDDDDAESLLLLVELLLLLLEEYLLELLKEGLLTALVILSLISLVLALVSEGELELLFGMYE